MPDDGFHLDTHVVPVEVSLGDGPPIVGQMFLRSSAADHVGPELVADRLNDGACFFPVRVLQPEPTCLLIGKAQVRYVVAPDSGGDERVALRRAAASQSGASVMLDDGEVLSGVVFIDDIPGRLRPLDFLNSLEQPFLILARPGQDYLINRNRIRYFIDTAS